jgi:hypothetical protein
VIYAKEASAKLIDGRWNLSQSEARLGIALSPAERQQLLACTGEIVCKTPDVHTEEEDRVGVKISATGVSVLRPDLLVTAKHVFFKGKRAVVSYPSCSFRSFARRKLAIPIVVEKDQRMGYAYNNEDFIVVRLKRELEGCNPFALDDADSSLREGEETLSVTGRQRNTLNKISGREPVVAKGTIRRVLDGVLGGPPFYYSDVDFDVGGSGGAVFALEDGRPVADGEGRLVLRGLSVAYGPLAKSGRPYSDERNYTIVIGLEADFRELVMGKAKEPAPIEPALCAQGGTAKIEVMADAVAPSGAEALASQLLQFACAKTANANCIKRAQGLKLAAAQRAKAKQEFRLKNATSCPICFTYDRCNDYGCWDETLRLSGKSMLYAGVRERAPLIKAPQFCKPG